MGFTDVYLTRCWENRSMWAHKPTYVGDWYLTGDPPELKVVGPHDAGGVSFANSEIAFVPDADDLFELFDNQVEAAGANPVEKSLTIRYSPESLWELDVEYGDNSSHVRGQESLHSLLMYALFVLAQRPG